MGLLFDLQDLRKDYDGFQAIKSITLQVAEGSIGLLGPNGAGKSTLIKTLLGLLNFSHGQARVLGFQLPFEALQIRQRVGYMPENDCYLPYMTATQYVAFGGELAGMPRREAFRRAHEILYFVGLEEARYRKLEGFSTGMKQRVKLAQALVHGPKLIFLDEPTNGLDPNGRDEMLSLIADVKSRGVNVVLCSHLLADVERVCDSIIVLNRGEVLHVGPIRELQQGGDRVLEVMTKNSNERLQSLLESQGFEVEVERSMLRVPLTEAQDPRQVLELAVHNDIQVRHFMLGQTTLENAFLDLLEAHTS